MRIAYLINQYPKISHSFIRREINALENIGCEVMRISLRGWDADLADDEDHIERARTRYVLRARLSTLLFSVTCILIGQPFRLLSAFGLAWRMSRHSDRPFYVHLGYLVEACRIHSWLRTADVKHLHAHFGTNSAEVAMLVNSLGGPPWSFTVHGPEEFDRAPLLGLAAKISHSSFVIAISSFGRAQLYRLAEPKFWKKIHVVHCGLDNPYLSALSDVEPLARRLVCIGRLSAQKGHLVLLEATRMLAEAGIDFRLIIAGDGEMRPEIQSWILRNKLADRIHITGWLSGNAVREEILAARALILPSLAEGLPVVIMEAMALGRPVISTFIAGIPELVRPGVDGWLVPASDVAALADAMRRCLEAPADQIRRMGESARERTLAQHDVNTEAAKLKQLFLATENDFSSSVQTG